MAAGSRAQRVSLSARVAPESGQQLVLTYGLLLSLLLAYIVSLLVRPNGATYTWLDGWAVDAFEFVVAGLCLGRAWQQKTRRAIPLILGLALLAWCAGDIALTIETLGGATAPSPSVADGFYLCFYPLAYIGLVLFMRHELPRLTMPSWLDGAIAGLGAATVCAAFAFRSLVHTTGGHPLATAVNLAYPIGDLLLLALVIGGSVITPARRQLPWVILALSFALIAAGDTFNLFERTVGATRIGTLFNAIAWPGAFMLISLAMWLRPQPVDVFARQRPAGFVLPGVAALGGLVVLFAGTVHHITDVALGLATATLVLVGVRLALSTRGLRLLTEQRHRQSITDDLTGLGNRRRLFNVLNTYFDELADRRLRPRTLAFLFLDLDHFKEINDSFGHPAGDELLRQLGPRFADSVRSSDVAVRLGGDEFAVVLFDADAEYAHKVAGRLLNRLQEPFLLDVVSATIGASIGIAMAPAHARDADSLLRCGDVAMYRAKLGPNAVELYNQDLDDDGNLLKLADELRTALEEGQFVLHYQPQLDLRSGSIAAVEALLRWEHPRLGMVPPMKFIPVAEEAGLMPALTSLVLDHALRQFSSWRDAGRQLDMSVNISPTNLLEPGFTEMVRTQLAKHNVPPVALVLELTETCVISQYERSKAVIEELRSLGVTVSIDDFGAGATSLAYLGDLAVGELKLDRTFVNGLNSPERSRDYDLVRSTIALGHALGMRVVAEGVEDLKTLDLLGRVGCDFAQGFYISKPLPARELVLSSDRWSDVPQPA